MFYIYYNPIGKNKRFAAKNQEYKDLLMDYYANTNICNGGKLLVLILYNNHEEMRLLRMHPESIMVDTTYGTNRGKKELFTVAGKDDNNVAFNACRAFLPNQQQWIFNLLFSESLPLFLVN